MQMKNLSLLIALAAFSPCAHAAFVWDDFHDGAAVLTANTVSWTTNTQAASVPGGFRDIENRQLVNLYGLNSTVATVGNEFTMSNDAGVYAASYLYYGSNGAFDLNLNGQGNQLEFKFDQVDKGLNFNVIVYSNGNSLYTSYGINLGPGAQTLDIPFSSFSGFGNFNHVSAMVVEFDQSSGVWFGNDIALKSIVVNGQPTPEPVSLTVLGLGAVGVMRRRRNCK